MTARHPTPEEREGAALVDAQGLDPTDLLRAMLAISREDAAAVREDAAEAMKPEDREPR